ncbi:MAG: AGE family epimerase/isomerase [Thermoproteota archaeon]
MLKLPIVAASLALFLSASMLSIRVSSVPGSDDYVLYAEEIAQKVRKYMHDETYGGYYFEVSRDWSSVSDSTKSFLGNCFIVRGFLQLYEKTGKPDYLSWAEEGIRILWEKCWNQTGKGGFFNEYTEDWKRKTDFQSLQEQADFVHTALDAYELTGEPDYREWANAVMHFIMCNYHDDVYKGMFKTRNGVTGEISDYGKHMEISLGAFAWAGMKWYSYTSNATAKTYSEECVNWMRSYLWNSMSAGYMSETDRMGSVTNNNYYPNIEIWGLVGMMEYYKQSANTTVKTWITEGLNHIRGKTWDSDYGGWYRKLNPDNSILEDTKTGWDNLEQPWFWYYAYEAMGDTAYRDVAVRSLDWTLNHLWDSTNGGIFLETNREGTNPTWDSKNDWVQGGAMVAFAYVTKAEPPATPGFSLSVIVIITLLTATLCLALKKHFLKRNLARTNRLIRVFSKGYLEKVFSIPSVKLLASTPNSSTISETMNLSMTSAPEPYIFSRPIMNSPGFSGISSFLRPHSFSRYQYMMRFTVSPKQRRPLSTHFKTLSLEFPIIFHTHL